MFHLKMLSVEDKSKALNKINKRIKAMNGCNYSAAKRMHSKMPGESESYEKRKKHTKKQVIGERAQENTERKVAFPSTSQNYQYHL